MSFKLNRLLLFTVLSLVMFHAPAFADDDFLIVAQAETQEEDKGGFFSNIFNRKKSNENKKPIFLNRPDAQGTANRSSSTASPSMKYNQITPPGSSFAQAMEETRSQNLQTSLAIADQRKQQTISRLAQYQEANQRRMEQIAQELQAAGALPGQGQGGTLQNRVNENLLQRYEQRRDNQFKDPARIFNNIK